MNAKYELIKEIIRSKHTAKDVAAINIKKLNHKYELEPLVVSSSLSESVLFTLNFDYDNGYGTQEISGVVLFKDNTWLSRGEYDGSEWWVYNKPPTVEGLLQGKS